MRIAVLTSLYPSEPKPYEGLFAERRWRGMAARGHAVSVVHPLPRTAWPLAFGEHARIHRMAAFETRHGIEIRRPRYLHLPRQARRNARAFARRGLASLEEADVVMLDYAWPAAAAAEELARAGRPCVVNGRGSDVLQVAGEAGLGEELSRGLRAAGHWCAVSRDLVEIMDRLAGTGAGTLVPNGVDLESFRPGDREAARARLGLQAGVPLVLVVGHLIPRKDPLLALEAFRLGAPPEAQLAFVGRGPLEAELQGAIGAARLDARVHLIGEVPPADLATWYAAADLLLLTSKREGRPNVVLEALACGRPVLATAAGGTAELLEANPRLLIEERSPELVGQRLAALLALEWDAERLRSSVESFSWERSFEALEGVLEAAQSSR